MDEMMDRELMKARRMQDERPRIAQTADRMHKAMAILAEELDQLQVTLRPVLREQENVPARLVEDPGTREGQSELHGIIRQWVDQAESMAQRLRDLRGQVEL